MKRYFFSYEIMLMGASYSQVQLQPVGSLLRAHPKTLPETRFLLALVQLHRPYDKNIFKKMLAIADYPWSRKMKRKRNEFWCLYMDLVYGSWMHLFHLFPHFLRNGKNIWDR